MGAPVWYSLCPIIHTVRASASDRTLVKALEVKLELEHKLFDLRKLHAAYLRHAFNARKI
jgi:hypothetical protein